MAIRLLTPATALAVSLDQAKKNLREDTTDQDDLITAWVKGITAHAEHYCGRSFINQTWRITLDSFPDAIQLPPPVQSVVIKFLDADGVQQTLDPQDYYVDAEKEPGWAVPAPNKEWPETYDRINSVTVDVVSGYGDSDTSVPNGIKLYLCAKLVEQFDPSIRLEKDTVQASYIDRLLDPFKVYG